MHIEQLRDYCLSKKETSEDFPFDEDTLVFKVFGKMFALVSLKKWESGEAAVNLKCNPEYAIELREQFESVYPGYHMSKKHWNTVTIEGNLPHSLIVELTNHSYDLVVKGLTKKLQKELGFI